MQSLRIDDFLSIATVRHEVKAIYLNRLGRYFSLFNKREHIEVFEC